MGRIEDFNAWAARDGWSTRVDNTLDFRAPKLRECLDVWTEAAAGRTMPARTDLKPRAMKNFLPNVVLWDVVREAARTRFRLRLMGTELRHAWGDGPTGGYVDRDVAEPFRTRWERIANLSLVLHRPLRCTGVVQYGNRTYLQSETFQAPLAGEDGEVGTILFVHMVQPIAHQPACAPAAAIGP